jgi:hypothetical protein
LKYGGEQSSAKRCGDEANVLWAERNHPEPAAASRSFVEDTKAPHHSLEVFDGLRNESRLFLLVGDKDWPLRDDSA